MAQARHPEEFVERVRVLWMQQPTIGCREIARMLNVTHNIVIGLAHRQEWPGRPSPIKRRAEGEMPKPSRLVPKPREATLPPLPSVGAAKLAPAKPGTLVRTCLYPLWPNGQKPGPSPKFCDVPVALGQVYCKEHRARCWTPAKAMRVPA